MRPRLDALQLQQYPGSVRNPSLIAEGKILIRTPALLFALLVPATATHAAAVSYLGTSFCSGELTSTLEQDAIFSCSGNLVLAGGRVTSDSKIMISAQGTLSISRVELIASTVAFDSSVIEIGPGTSIKADSIVADSGGDSPPRIDVAAGATLTTGDGTNLPIVDSRGSVLVVSAGGNAPLPGDPGNISLQPVPLPPSLALLISGLIPLLGLSTRRKNRTAGWVRPAA